MARNRIEELGIIIPDMRPPLYNYVPVKLFNGLAYVSGQLPKVNGELKVTGKVGGAVSVDTSRELARICILNALACLKQTLGDIDRIDQVIKVTGFVASAPGFGGQPKVIDAASDLLVEIFGDAGRHARSAIGVAELPLDTPVEIELIVAYRDN